jgi:CheY-like chemotaxis protein
VRLCQGRKVVDALFLKRKVKFFLHPCRYSELREQLYSVVLIYKIICGLLSYTILIVSIVVFRQGNQVMDESLTGSESVMLIDDDDLIRNIGNDLLERFGYSVTLAKSGEEGLAMFKEAPDSFDLILLDLSMPGMGGHDCLKFLLEVRPELKVIIASGFDSREEAGGLLAEGAASYLPKPYGLKELMSAVRSTIDN